MRRQARAMLLAALGLLAACGTDTDATAGAKLAQGLAAGLVRPGAKPVAPPVPTRALIANIRGPLLLAEVPSAGAVAFLAPVARNGGVETWSTAEDITVSLRDGMLAGTRGLGQDLMSVAGPTSAMIAAGSGSHARAHFYLDGADQTLRRGYDCTLSSDGAEQIVVLERSFATRRVTERCSGTDGSFVNRYWLGAGSRIVRSDQMVEPSIGTMRLSRLQD